MIEADIVPRLLLAHRGTEPRTTVVDPGIIAPSVADQFAAATLEEEVGPLLARIEALIAAGIEVETIYLHLLAPAARRLGEMWEDDSCDFVDVTMGLWRLQELVHALGSLAPGRGGTDGLARRALLAPAPGEQHSLGAILVEEFFRRAGWQTWSAPTLDEDELLSLVAGRGFDVIGLSVAADRNLAGLTRTIAQIRRASRNPDLVVLVGGRPFVETPQLATEVGADGTAADGRLAVAMAESLLTKRLRAGVTHAN
ncbi:hypothetical protein IP88_03455 [alpha proteobacterium AAP81b]|nr:hypothetical protein IP88_03455 [alpha proteobacterium AAP81b]